MAYLWIDALSMVSPQQFSIGVFVIILVMHVGSNVLNCTNYIVSSCTGSGNRGAWPLLNLRPLHRNVIFPIENHFSLAKCPPPLLLVASSTCEYHSYVTECNIPHYIYINDKHIVKDCYFRK